MDFRGWPRHQLRASGRHFGRSGRLAPQNKSNGGIEAKSQAGPAENGGARAISPAEAGFAIPVLPDSQSSLDCSQKNASEFLNYLSHSTAVAERELFGQAAPSFAAIRGLELLAPRKQSDRLLPEDGWNPNPRHANAAQSASGESYLSELAELLAVHAQSVVCKAPEQSTLTSESVCERISAVTLLDRWLSDGAENDVEQPQGEDDYYDEQDYDTIYGDASFADEVSVEESRSEAIAALKQEAQPQPASAPRCKRPITNFKEPDLRILPGGRRKERFESGAEVVKDSLGRVIEVRSPLGPVLRARYDDRGDLRFFVRTDGSGNLESYGEGDKHGVIVRDPSGRVRAAGETMTVDRVGRLSIVRRDGQFWSIDMARGLHVERRQLADDEGRWKALTAVFAFDGFRMVTRFQGMDSADQKEHQRAAVTETIRLYGRDGSVIEFDSEDDIEALRPARVWPPGSRKVDKTFRGKWQAGTAWQAVKEYVELLRSGSG